MPPQILAGSYGQATRFPFTEPGGRLGRYYIGGGIGCAGSEPSDLSRSLIGCNPS